MKSLAKLPESVQCNLEIDFIGEAYKDYKNKLCKIHKTLCPKVQIHFLGYRKNVLNELENYHVGINCSGSEAFGRTTIEYLLAGLVVIASDTGANPELIEHEKTGFLYKYGNIDDLSKQIMMVYQQREKWVEIMRVGKKRAQSEFSEKKYAENVYQTYCNLGK